MKKILLPVLTFLMLGIFSCKKSDELTPVMRTILNTEHGTPDGLPNSLLINAASGGTITSIDGRISVIIPAGAMNDNMMITIQPVINKMPNGKGKAYRLSPAHLNFSKPVTIRFNYEEDELQGTLPELLGIAFQGEDGTWSSANGAQVDKTAKTISTVTRHFSDWGFFPFLYIDPIEDRVPVNGTTNLRVMYSLDPATDHLLMDLETATPLTEPFQVDPSFVKRWIYNGAGQLSSNGATASYKAPSTVPAQNPEAISAEINFRSQALLLLVSNITVLSEFHIDYMQVDETESSQPNNSYPSRLFIYGNFGADPGAGQRSVKVNNIGLTISTWSPKLIVCDITSVGPGSSGNVVVTSGNESTSKLLNEWTVHMEYAKKESPDGSLTRRVTFVVRFRGDATDFNTGETEPILEYTNLNNASKALVNVTGAQFSTTVDNIESCGTYTVQWAPINSLEVERKLMSEGDGFRGRVYQTPTGFKIRMYFETDLILKSTKSFVSCLGNAQQTVVMEQVTNIGYDDEEILVTFENNSSRPRIAAGGPAMLISTGAAPGLFWNAGDVTPTVFTTKLEWEAADPKFN